MSSKIESDASSINSSEFLTPDFYQDPYTYYDYLRNNNPLHFNDQVHAWMVSKYEDVSKLVSDRRCSVVNETTYLYSDLTEQEKDELDSLKQFYSHWLLYLDPPVHTEIRKSVNKAFTPKAIQDREIQIEATVDEKLQLFESSQSIDVLSGFAEPMSVSIVSNMMGIPEEDYPSIKAWSDDIVGFFVGRSSDYHGGLRAEKAIVDITNYLDTMINQLDIRHENSDILSQLSLSESQGIISREALVAIYANILVDGHEPIANTFANGLLALLQNKDQLDMHREDPELIENGIDEILRFDTPFQYVSRTAKEQIDMQGKSIMSGDRLLFLLGSANRDSNYYPEADILDLTRDASKHRSFGLGTHYCLGATLAKPALKTAFTKFIDRFPNVSLIGDPEWHKVFGFRGLTALPVSY